MARLSISLLFLTFTFATMIGFSRHYQAKVERTEHLTANEIQELINNNPTAAGNNDFVSTASNDSEQSEESLNALLKD